MLPAPALADTVSGTDRGGVRSRGLITAERRALDIDKLKAIGSEAGLLVSVDLKGNTQRRLGRGHLRRALVAVVLVPRSGSGGAPAVLATRGPGPTGETLRRTRSKDVLVTRDGDKLLFSFLGDVLANVARIEVATFTRAALRRARAAQIPGQGQIFGAGARLADSTAVRVPDPAVAACETLRAAVAAKEREVDGLADGIKQYQNRLDRKIPALDRIKTQLRAEEAFAPDKADPAELRRLRAQREFLEDSILETRGALKGLEKSRRAAVRQLDELRVARDSACAGGPVGTPPTPGEVLALIMAWSFFGADEVFTEDARFVNQAPSAAQSSSPITAVRIVIPDEGSTNRHVTSFLCPTQLPNGTLESTSGANDTLLCSGGTLAIGERFKVNVRTSPNPSSGMGGQVFGQQDGQFKGPFNITGP